LELFACSNLYVGSSTGGEYNKVSLDLQMVTNPFGMRCALQKEGGKLGTFQEGMMVPTFDQVVFDAATVIGEIAGPVKTDFGYHLIRVESRMLP